MSLIRSGIRIAAVLALKNATQAGALVFDSRMAAIDELALEKSSPVISVYTDEHQMKGFIPGQGIPHLNLIVEMSFAHFTQSQAVDSTGHPLFEDEQQTTPVLEYSLWQPNTDTRMELALDLMEQQVMDALFATETPAGAILEELTLKREMQSSQRAVFGKDHGNRLAARQVFFTFSVLNDTQPGAQIHTGLERLFALMESDEVYSAVVGEMRGFAGRQSGRPVAYQDISQMAAGIGTGASLRIMGNQTPGRDVPLQGLEINGLMITPEETQ